MLSTVQAITPARQENESDRRNQVSLMGALHFLNQQITNKHLWVNIDSTRYCLKSNKKNRLVAENKQLKTITSKIVSHNKMDVYVKSFLIMNTDGYVGPLVYCIANSSLGKDAFEFFPIEGVSNSPIPAVKCYICFTKSRCLNKFFFEWIVEVVFDFINGLIKVLSISQFQLDNVSKNTNALLMFDGETTYCIF
jgi:hypothetical protein